MAHSPDPTSSRSVRARATRDPRRGPRSAGTRSCARCSPGSTRACTATQGFSLDVRPFASGSWTYDNINGTQSLRGKPGVDAFYNLTPSLKLTTTVKTDFAETVADQRQINLGRFGLFFSESAPSSSKTAASSTFRTSGRANFATTAAASFRPAVSAATMSTAVLRPCRHRRHGSRDDGGPYCGGSAASPGRSVPKRVHLRGRKSSDREMNEWLIQLLFREGRAGQAGDISPVNVRVGERVGIGGGWSPESPSVSLNTATMTAISSAKSTVPTMIQPMWRVRCTLQMLLIVVSVGLTARIARCECSERRLPPDRAA